MGKRTFSFALLILSLILVFWNMKFSFTGNVIGEYFGGGSSFWHLLGIVFFIVSIFLLNGKR